MVHATVTISIGYSYSPGYSYSIYKLQLQCMLQLLYKLKLLSPYYTLSGTLYAINYLQLQSGATVTLPELL